LLHFQDVPVEGAEVISHADQDGYMIFANGSLTKFDVDRSYEPMIPEPEALTIALDSLEGQSFAWNNLDWENAIKEDLEDPNATHYPKGKLIFALDSINHLGWKIQPRNYRLAWEFDIITLDQGAHRAILVDAITGQIFRIDTLGHGNGSATILNQGPQIIDDRWKGFPTNKFILKTNNNGRQIHTKYGNMNTIPFIFKPNIKNKNNNWGSSDQRGTTAHWCATQAWDFFASSPYNHPGPDGQNGKLRVYADSDLDKAMNHYVSNIDYIEFGELYNLHLATIDIVGHEYAHSVVGHTSQLANSGEPGALNESFSDISGFMVERYAEGSISDWLLGESVYAWPRSLKAPKSGGWHLINNGSQKVIGQPDTYRGQFWYNGIWNSGGIDINSGVQNHWFYLLSNGGSGVNDVPLAYNVQGIGVDKAARITFWTYMNVLLPQSNYGDARTGSITSAGLIFGNCSYESIQTENAWYAVGVGNQSSCPNIGLSQLDSSKPTLYPNPTEGDIYISLNQASDGFFEIYASSGNTLERITFKNDKLLKYNLRDRPSGVYLIRVVNEDETFNYRVSKK
jgi:Zn-dependent metalloprotease